MKAEPLARIAALEAESERIAAELAALKNPPKVVDPPYVEPPLPDWRNFRKITDAQARRALEWLRSNHPCLLPNRPLEDLLVPFAVAVTALEVRFKRLDAPDRLRFVGEFCDRVERVAHSIGAPTRYVNELTFPAAIILGAPYVLYGNGTTPALGIGDVGQPFNSTYDKICDPDTSAAPREKPVVYNENRYGTEGLWLREVNAFRQSGW